jgi:hypothetical protein
VKTYNKLTTNLVINIVKINRLKQGKNDTKAIQNVIIGLLSKIMVSLLVGLRYRNG